MSTVVTGTSNGKGSDHDSLLLFNRDCKYKKILAYTVNVIAMTKST